MLKLVNISLFKVDNNKLGIGDWGLGIGPNPQSPIPNPLLIRKAKNINKI